MLRRFEKRYKQSRMGRIQGVEMKKGLVLALSTALLLALATPAFAKKHHKKHHHHHHHSQNVAR